MLDDTKIWTSVEEWRRNEKNEEGRNDEAKQDGTT